jgi:hypothetical protein
MRASIVVPFYLFPLCWVFNPSVGSFRATCAELFWYFIGPRGYPLPGHNCADNFAANCADTRADNCADNCADNRADNRADNCANTCADNCADNWAHDWANNCADWITVPIE